LDASYFATSRQEPVFILLTKKRNFIYHVTIIYAAVYEVIASSNLVNCSSDIYNFILHVAHISYFL